MVDVNNSRRSFLRKIGLAAGSAAGAMVVSGQAQAFRLLPADDYATILQSSCVADSEERHRELLSQVEKEMGIKLDEKEAQDILRQMSCPTCGCNLQAAYMNDFSLSGF